MNDLGGLVQAALDGDETAWAAIVDRFSGLVWSTARSHRLSNADAADVVQLTWLRLVEHLDRINDPDRLGAWLATTARRESLRVLRLAGRQQLTGEIDQFEEPVADELDLAMLTSERDSALWRAFSTLSEHCQALLRMLVAATEPSYEEVSAALGMPIGAIGPTRMRCLDPAPREHRAAGDRVSVQDDPDELLLGELSSLLDAVDPVPPEVDAAAKAILGWRRLDADLAELLADSAVDSDRLAGVRGEGDPSLRRLSFGGAPLELDLEVHTGSAAVTVLGQLAPGAAASIKVERLTADDEADEETVAADELGRFRLELPTGTTFRLIVTGHPTSGTRPTVTDWVQV